MKGLRNQCASGPCRKPLCRGAEELTFGRYLQGPFGVASFTPPQDVAFAALIRVPGTAPSGDMPSDDGWNSCSSMQWWPSWLQREAQTDAPLLFNPS